MRELTAQFGWQFANPDVVHIGTIAAPVVCHPKTPRLKGQCGMTPGHIWDLEVCSVRSCLQCVKPADNKWAFVEERTLGSKGTLPGPGHIAMHCQSCNFLLRLPLKLVIRKVMLKGIAHLQPTNSFY